MKHVFIVQGDGHICGSQEFGCSLCTLDVCKVCKLAEASLTTDCPGPHSIDPDLEYKIIHGKMDYVSARGGWVNELSPNNKSALRAHIISILKGRNSYTREELMLLFHLTESEFEFYHEECKAARSVLI